MANLTNGGLSGGYGKYLQNLVPLLAAHPKVDQLFVTVPHGAQMSEVGGVQLVPMLLDSHRRNFSDVAETAAAQKVDVVFVPTARWRSFEALPVVCMIRNMEPLQVPFAGNSLVDCLKNLGRLRAAKEAAVNSTRLIAVSRTVANHVVERWNLNPERVAVVHHGVATSERSLLGAQPPPSLSVLWKEPFLFTAGSIRPARGLEDAIGALGALKTRGVNHRLAVAGHVDWTTSFGSHLKKLVSESSVGEQVYWLGQLSAEEMAWCYDNSSAFLMTSRSEACPNTLLEAMAHSCLCVATKIEVMQEFLGPDAMFYAPGNPLDLSSILERIGSIPGQEFETYRKDALARSLEFTWERTADRTIDELALAAGNDGH